jgi:hypothetical protein
VGVGGLGFGVVGMWAALDLQPPDPAPCSDPDATLCAYSGATGAAGETPHAELGECGGGYKLHGAAERQCWH